MTSVGQKLGDTSMNRYDVRKCR